MAKNRLKKILEENGLSQAELAREAKISISTVNRVCQQRTSVAPTTESKIAIGVTKLCPNGKEYIREDIFEPSD